MKAIITLLISGILPCILSATSLTFTKATGSIWTKISPDEKARLDHLLEMSEKHLEKTNVGTSVGYAYLDSATMFCDKRKIEYPSLLHLLKAEYFYLSGDYTSSEEEATLAMGRAKSSGDNETLAKTMLFLGRYYRLTGFYKESIDHYNNGISVAEKHDLKGIIPLSYHGQAEVFNAANDLKNYRKYLDLMIEAGLAENDTPMIADGCLMLGTSFTDKEWDFKMADSILRRCVDLSMLRKDTFLIAFASANIGWNFYRNKMYDSSVYYYEKSLRYSIPGTRISVSANSFGNLGTINRDLGNYQDALRYYEQSIEHAKKAKDWYSLSWVYHDMSDLYNGIGDTSKAFESFILYKKFDDSLLIAKNTQGMTEARVRYEADTHNKEVALLSLRLKNNRLLNIGFIGFIILAAAIGFLLFRGSKLKDKRRISEMNRKISELTQSNLRQQMNPHFIFNTLNSIQYYMYQHDKLATNTYLTKFSSLMRKVLENSNHTSIPLRDELDALNLYLELESLRFRDKFDYNITIDEEIDTLLFKVPTMLIQPYVENSICHGLMPKAEKGLVNITLKLNEDHIICTIQDNGIGREAAYEKMKNKEGNHFSLGTRIVSSRLDLVNELYGTSLTTHYTDLKNEKGEADGTRVEIHIPIMT